MSKANFDEKSIPKPTPKMRIVSIYQPFNPVVMQFIRLSRYMTYNVVAYLENLKVNICLIDVLRAHEQQ